jgi:hypothetical protein
MYIRFVIEKIDEDSGHRQGLFQAMSDLEEAGKLDQYEAQRYKEIYKWFAENLKKPNRLAKSRSPNAKSVALSWFKDTANDHLKHIWEVVGILESHGVSVEVLRTERPGYLVYEDEHQVTAEPFYETQT